MFNIGFTEFLVIGVVALVFIGPKQLPEVARVVGRLLGELRKATQDLSGGLLEVTQDVRNTIDQTKEDIINEGRKAASSVIDPVADLKDDFSSDMGYGHHDEEFDHDEHDLENESNDQKEEEPTDGKS